jgi:hypothetical protein
MKRISLATAAIAILLAPPISRAGRITYSLQNYAADQNGSALTGSVTTDGNLGALTATDIVSWTWTISGPVGSPLTVSGVTSTVSLLTATDQQLLLPAAPLVLAEFYLVVPGSGSLEYFRPTTTSQQAGIYSGFTQLVDFWITDSPRMGGTDPWVIGVAAASVPEPSSVALLELSIAGLLGRAWNRSRRKHRN